MWELWYEKYFDLYIYECVKWFNEYENDGVMCNILYYFLNKDIVIINNCLLNIVWGICRFLDICKFVLGLGNIDVYKNFFFYIGFRFLILKYVNGIRRMKIILCKKMCYLYI